MRVPDTAESVLDGTDHNRPAYPLVDYKCLKQRDT